MGKNTEEPSGPQMTIWRMRIACWVTTAKKTHTLCKAHCFSTTTMAARTRLNVTSYVYCLSCLFFVSEITLLSPLVHRCCKVCSDTVRTGNDKYINAFFTSICFTLFCFNAPFQFTLLKLRPPPPLNFGLTPFGWFICIYFSIFNGNTNFNLRPL